MRIEYEGHAENAVEVLIIVSYPLKHLFDAIFDRCSLDINDTFRN